MESITKIAQTTYPMNIVIAHFNTHWVDNPGGVEKSTCQLAMPYVKEVIKLPSFTEMDVRAHLISLWMNLFRLIISYLKTVKRLSQTNSLHFIEWQEKLPASSDKIMLRESMQNTRESNMVRQLKDVLRIFIRISSYQPRFHQLNTF